jgi:Cof subfamily protein (haloacid dehalogenase superfamily)
MPEFLPAWDTADIQQLDRFSRIRLIALDVDGTLLQRSADELSSAVQSLSRKLRHVGGDIQLTIATGRALAGVGHLARSLNPGREVPVVVYNGALVAFPGSGRCLYHLTISADATIAVFQLAQKYQLLGLAYTIVECPMGIESEPILEAVYGWSGSIPCEYREFNGLPVRWIMDLHEFPKTAATAILLDIRNRLAPPGLFDELAEVAGISTTSSSSSFLEIRPAGADKGLALEFLARQMHIQRDQVLAVGDSDNDIEMLKWAGTGVAVGTSSIEALAIADFLCRHGAMAAVIEVLRLVRQAKRLSRGLSLAEMKPGLTNAQ